MLTPEIKAQERKFLEQRKLLIEQMKSYLLTQSEDSLQDISCTLFICALSLRSMYEYAYTTFTEMHLDELFASYKDDELKNNALSNKDRIKSVIPIKFLSEDEVELAKEGIYILLQNNQKFHKQLEALKSLQPYQEPVISQITDITNKGKHSRLYIVSVDEINTVDGNLNADPYKDIRGESAKVIIYANEKEGVITNYAIFAEGVYNKLTETQHSRDVEDCFGLPMLSVQSIGAPFSCRQFSVDLYEHYFKENGVRLANPPQLVKPEYFDDVYCFVINRDVKIPVLRPHTRVAKNRKQGDAPTHIDLEYNIMVVLDRSYKIIKSVSEGFLANV